jgi:mRNA interferase RelE/StbE
LAWRVEFAPRALKELNKIDRTWQNRIVTYLEDIAELPDPRLRGDALTANRAGFWRYRIGDYRVICRFQDDVFVVEVVRVAHRRNVYD